ncbi:AraC family transcriptional regulator [Flavobacterium gelatinilyticum]|uniref:AraC family transcriptional regulator n=1 Tax=Flavobacterium gelatinilyticum TaxID=3003260 RepID=UPI00248084D6|nr:helix-turn-helix domain-containing protein [Flavobacterium gelatinilyticum]
MRRNIPNLAIDEITLGENIKWDTRDYYASNDPVHNILRYFPVRQDFYMISLCTSGTVRVRLNGGEVCIEAGTLSTFTPATIIEVLEISEDYGCHLVIFMKSFLIETLNNIYFIEKFHFLNNNGLFNLKLEKEVSAALLAHIAGIIARQKDKKHPFRRDIIRNQIIILLYEAENSLKTKTADHDIGYNYGKNKIVSDFQQLLAQNFFTQRKVGFYSKRLNVTTQSLTNSLKLLTGKSAKEQIEDMVISQAKVLLKSGKYNVSEIASQLSYNNLEEFSRFFKKKTGITALKFSKSQT